MTISSSTLARPFAANTFDPTLVQSFAANVDWLYAGLVRNADLFSVPDLEKGLRGQFLYAGELDGAGCVLVVAANIAGAASLAATADLATQRQAFRDGVIDFLVTTLGEALRILKNELRKGEAVAVCVTQAPEDVEREMKELGVLPDLLPPGTVDAPRFEEFLRYGAKQVDPVSANDSQTVMTWSVDAAPTLWLPKLDAVAMDCVGSSQSLGAWSARRWIRMAPRYLGRLAKGMRLLRCNNEAAHEFVNRVQEKVACGQFGVSVEICLTNSGESESYLFSRHGTLPHLYDLSHAGRRQPQSSSIIL